MSNRCEPPPPRAVPPDVAVVIPALGLPERLEGLLAVLPADIAIYVVDDGSPEPLTPSRGVVLRHARNQGYGAAQKTGYERALRDGARRVVLLHGDGQYDPLQTLALADDLETADAVFGTRFGAPTPPMPRWRRAGIRTLAAVANARFATSYTDLHNGARAWRAEVLARIPWNTFADDWLFDQQMVCALLSRGAILVEKPVGMTYEGRILSIPPGRAVRYGLGCLGEIARTLPFPGWKR